VITYVKLWKILVERGIKKHDLKLAVGIGSTTVQKLTRDECVSMSVLIKICIFLGCDIGDVVEMKDKTNHA